MPYIIFMCGLPGSGKSTFRYELLEKNSDYVVISSDDIIDDIATREGKTYSDVFKSSIKKADYECRARFQEAVAARKDIIIDRTNLTRKSRASWLVSLPSDYTIEAVIFEVDPEILSERLAKRGSKTGKNIPIQIIQSMRDLYERPSYDEGFSQIHENI